MKVKRPMTLIEVLVSLGLFSLLLSTLFFCYSLFFKHKHTIEAQKKEVSERRYAFGRIENILASAKSPFFKSEEDESLIFFFERGVCEEPLLSGTVLGRLYFDSDHKALCLGIWPRPEREKPLLSPCQTLVLLENIDGVEFHFYCPPDPEGKVVNPEKIDSATPKTGWQKNWSLEYNQLPALIKITLTRGKETILTMVDLQLPIYYPKDKIET